jgi:hypothetical protein
VKHDDFVNPAGKPALTRALTFQSACSPLWG